jgi:hypothetical protein
MPGDAGFLAEVAGAGFGLPMELLVHSGYLPYGESVTHGPETPAAYKSSFP